MRYIAFDLPGESTSLAAVNPEERRPEESEDEFLHRMAAMIVPSGVSYALVEPSEIPTKFPRARRIAAGQVVISMPVARGEFLRLGRAARNALLQGSDTDIVRGIEQGTDTSSLKAARQALRDWPTLVASGLAAATTPEEIEALPWPTKP